jgi:uncharacterized protein (DUF1501 family)
MVITPETIDHNALTRLVEAGAVRGADVIGQSPGLGCGHQVRHDRTRADRGG